MFPWFVPFDIDAGALIRVIIWAAVTAMFVWVWGAVFKKAGYSRWMGLLSLMPCMWMLIPVALTFMAWPVTKELSLLRINAGYGSERDAFVAMEEADRLSRHGQNDKAMSVYQQVARMFEGKQAGNDATCMIEVLSKQAGPQDRAGV